MSQCLHRTHVSDRISSLSVCFFARYHNQVKWILRIMYLMIQIWIFLPLDDCNIILYSCADGRTPNSHLAFYFETCYWWQCTLYWGASSFWWKWFCILKQVERFPHFFRPTLHIFEPTNIFITLHCRHSILGSSRQYKKIQNLRVKRGISINGGVDGALQNKVAKLSEYIEQQKATLINAMTYCKEII